MEENEASGLRWDRVATGRRHASLHRDVRFLACHGASQKPHSPLRDLNQTPPFARQV
jgi:hypothetical protein